MSGRQLMLYFGKFLPNASGKLFAFDKENSSLVGETQ